MIEIGQQTDATEARFFFRLTLGGDPPWTLVKEAQGYSPPLRFLVNKQTSVCPIEFIRRENFAPTHIRHSHRGL